jgi:hypothetical protein
VPLFLEAKQKAKEQEDEFLNTHFNGFLILSSDKIWQNNEKKD